MNEQDQIDFNKIAEAIHYIQAHFKDQPSLEQIAAQVYLSPFHFQRLFTEWAGVSPKKFLQFISLDYVKSLLRKREISLFEAALETGFSGGSRLHDLFVKIEGMTPGEFKNGGAHLRINFSFAQIPFGKILVASTTKGICHMSFTDDENHALDSLKELFPNATYHQLVDPMQQNALFVFTKDWRKLNEIKLHLRGTDFQIKVWQTLLNIPMGALTTYGNIAQQINKPKAARAVGTAIGGNPVAFLIPCHRVIQTNGSIGGYMWGPKRKLAMIGWEGVKTSQA